jgi:hypothetical protein
MGMRPSLDEMKAMMHGFRSDFKVKREWKSMTKRQRNTILKKQWMDNWYYEEYLADIQSADDSRLDHLIDHTD